MLFNNFEGFFSMTEEGRAPKSVVPRKAGVIRVVANLVGMAIGTIGLWILVHNGDRRYAETYLMMNALVVLVAIVIIRYLTVLVPTLRGNGGVRSVGSRVIFGSALFFSAKAAEIERYEVVMARSFGVDLPHVRLHLAGNRKRDLPVYLILDGEKQAVYALQQVLK